MSGTLTVTRTGFPVLVQDRGRPGLAAIGVGGSGAADRGALALGNRLLANPTTSAGLEITLGGLEVTIGDTQTLALTGAVAAASLDGQPVPFGQQQMHYLCDPRERRYLCEGRGRSRQHSGFRAGHSGCSDQHCADQCERRCGFHVYGPLDGRYLSNLY